jgi:transposase
MADDVAGTEIARRTGYTPVQVSRIRRRFPESGIAGLHEGPRSGRPREISEAKSARIVALTLKATRGIDAAEYSRARPTR